MSKPPAETVSGPLAAGELEVLAAATAAAGARARLGDLDSLTDIAERVDRVCAGLAADADRDRLRAQLVSLAHELESLMLVLERGRIELARELAQEAAGLAARHAYTPPYSDRS